MTSSVVDTPVSAEVGGGSRGNDDDDGDDDKNSDTTASSIARQDKDEQDSMNF